MTSCLDDYLRLDDEHYAPMPTDQNQTTQAYEPMDEELLKSVRSTEDHSCHLLTITAFRVYRR